MKNIIAGKEREVTGLGVGIVLGAVVAGPPGALVAGLIGGILGNQSKTKNLHLPFWKIEHEKEEL